MEVKKAGQTVAELMKKVTERRFLLGQRRARSSFSQKVGCSVSGIARITKLFVTSRRSHKEHGDHP